jgi:class 3 adenylate cyclase
MAGAGTVVVSEAVVDAAGSIPVFFTRIGPVELKGVAPVPLFAARSAVPPMSG